MLHDELSDWRWLASDLASRPTRIAETVQSLPHYIGACDASALGMGGVWFPPSRGHDPLTSPILRRFKFPTAVSDNVVSFSNPTGTITNSDLELAGVVAQQGEHTNATLCDNTPAVARESFRSGRKE
ncbi:MAG: hypothetical protein ACREBR_01185 [bacterium]